MVVYPGQVVQAVGGRVPVLLDGGVRRGTDVFKALALGAQAVLVRFSPHELSNCLKYGPYLTLHFSCIVIVIAIAIAIAILMATWYIIQHIILFLRGLTDSGLNDDILNDGLSSIPIFALSCIYLLVHVIILAGWKASSVWAGCNGRARRETGH